MKENLETAHIMCTLTKYIAIFSLQPDSLIQQSVSQHMP